MLNEKILWLPSILLFERTVHNLNHPIVYGPFGHSQMYSAVDFCPRLASKEMNACIISFATDKGLIYDPFQSFFASYINIFHKTDVLAVIL